MPGAKAVFEKFTDYVPRQEKASWLAGGKQMLVDRVEWVVIPDPATAAAALQNGEVDWWENPIPDLVPVLRKNRNVSVDIADPLGNVGSFRMNHLHPPFNDVRARRAVLTALSQEDYMRALVGDDTSLWKPLPGFFTPNTPLYTEEGGEILKGKRDFAVIRDAFDLARSCRVGVDERDGDALPSLQKRPGNGTLDKADLAQLKFVDFGVVDQNREMLLRQRILPDKWTQLDHQAIGSRAGRSRQFERALAADRPGMARFWLTPTRAAKRVAVSGDAEVDQKFVTAASHTTTPWSIRRTMPARE